MGDLRFGIWGRSPNCAVVINTELPFYALNFAYTGELSYRAGNGPRVTLRAPVAFITRPGRHYRYHAVSGDRWDQSYVTFEGDLADVWARHGLIPSDTDSWRHVPDPIRFRGKVDRLFGLLALNERGWDDATVLLRELLLETRRMHEVPQPATEVAEAVRRWAQSVEHSPEGALRVSEAARALSVSESTFRRTVRALFGIAPSEFLLRARLANAAVALRSTSDAVGAIATRAGFYDAAHFARTFRGTFGVSPSAYRGDSGDDLLRSGRTSAPRKRRSVENGVRE
ncbi:AraC family transcriptional regulator [Lysobacter korlensis]|uniref:AraC family transcriptional regulator n=1 Tax=Lysobacter korlensis TaxID=553636 RepID=A0ABV6RSY7_9GAMM